MFLQKETEMITRKLQEIPSPNDILEKLIQYFNKKIN